MKRGRVFSISHWASGWSRKMPIRPVSESASLGTNSTFAEPVKMKRPAVLR